MQKNILRLTLSFVICLTTLFIGKSQAQNLTPGEQTEKIFSFWTSRLEMARVAVGADKREYTVFTRFYAHQLDSMQIDFINKANTGIINVHNAERIMDEKEKYFIALYHSFADVRKEFPSSVDEYKNEPRPRIGGDSCFASCYNTDFEDGTLDGWYGYYGVNSSPDNNVGPFKITRITGGYCGPVVRAGGPDPYTGNDYQIRITSGAATDWFLNTYSTYSMPQVSPFGGNHSVLLGDTDRNGQGTAILSQSFVVSPGTASLTYQYALFLENPSGHLYYAQPFFSVAVLDQHGDTIPICGQYSVSADSAKQDHFKGIYFRPELDSVYWKNWTLVNLPLKKYIGQCITISFQVQDCSLGGHFGYAYVDASCAPLQLITSSPALCGQDSISLTAPPGSNSYLWRGPSNGSIRGDSTKQIVWVDSAGTYRVITTPVTGIQCADTLFITIGKTSGPPPKPSFYTTVACAGQATHFINTSNPIGGSFYWDFYNIGNYNDSNITNPTWTYASPGTYTVKLHEVFNGCGTDTLIIVHIDSSVVAGFNASGACAGTLINMTNTSVGASGYFWNYGDPPLFPNDTSSVKNGFHTYNTAGNYTVTLIAKSNGTCPDTITKVIKVTAIPKPIITGKDSVCPGMNDTLKVTGGTTYVWSNGATTTSIAIVASNTTYTVTASNGTCTHDTTFTLHTVTPSAIIATSKDSVCSGDSLTLQGSGGTAYKWQPGNLNTQTVHVRPNVSTTYTLFATKGLCTAKDSVTIGMIKPVSAVVSPVPDSTCPGQFTTLSVSAAGGGGPASSYRWYPGGQTTPTINVNPMVTTTYTATVYGKCDSNKHTITVTVIPLPKVKVNGTLWKCKGVKDTLTVSNLGGGKTTYLWSNGSTTTSYTTKGITGPINADSTISVTAYNVLHCDTTIVFKIAVRPPPTVTVLLPGIACPGNTVQLTADANGIAGPFTYKWSDGETTSTIDVSPSTITTYSVTVSNGCKTIATGKVIPDNPPLNVCCNTTVNMYNDTSGHATLSVSGNKNGIKTYSWQPTVVCKNPPVCDSVIATPTVTTTYTVSGIDSLGCLVERVVTVTVDIPCFNPTIPNVITPNYPGPMGVNDEFYIKTENINSWNITIYDRWGKEMYKSTNQYEYWKGTTEGGAKASDGVYYYIITGVCQNTTFKKDGFVQLIR